jgi:hypothetical protein
VAAWLAGASVLWLVAGVLLCSVIPFTLIVILPTNKRLLDPKLDKTSAVAERLLAHWGGLHAVRSVAEWIGAAVIPVLANLFAVAMITRCSRMPHLERTVQDS